MPSFGLKLSTTVGAEGESSLIVLNKTAYPPEKRFSRRKISTYGVYESCAVRRLPNRYQHEIAMVSTPKYREEKRKL
jgi:hypothetical protein